MRSALSDFVHHPAGQRAGCLIVCLLGVFTCTTALAEASTAPGDNIETVEQQLSANDQQLQQLNQELTAGRSLKARLQASLDAVGKSVQERTQRLSQLQSDLRAYEAQLQRLEAQVRNAQDGLETRRARLAESLRRSQQLGKGSALKSLLQQDDPATAQRLNIYTGYFMQAQMAAIQQETAALARIDAAHQEALRDRNWVQHIQSKAARQHQSLTQQQNEQQQSLTQVERDIDQRVRSVAQLKADQTRLQGLLDELRASAERASGYFAARQGRYGMPVDGQITARFGDTKAVGRLRWTGWFIEAEAGKPVRAIADGEIRYADWLNGFGMLVIVDHGDSYMTLYGGNRELLARAGDWVETGATLATVGDSGGQTSSGVYFEVRHNAKPVNPQEWVSAENPVLAAK